MSRVVVADKIGAGGVEIMRSNGLGVDVRTDLSEDRFISVANQYEGMPGTVDILYDSWISVLAG